MRPTRRLRSLRVSVFQNLSRLEVRINNVATNRRMDPWIDMVVSYACVSLLATWSNFVRAYYLSCFLHPRREGGGRVSVDSAFIRLPFNDGIAHAITTLRPLLAPPPGGAWHRRDEPTWHEPRTLRTLSASIGCSNRQDIIDGFGINSRVFLDLPTFRNFYAHRNRESYDAALSLRTHYGITARGHPTSVLLARAYGRHQALILDWVADLRNVVEYLCL